MLVKAGQRGVDYAFGRPTPESLIRAGYSFVVRYLSVPPASASKNLTAPERDQLLNAGLGLLVVWEMSASTPDKGAPQGVVDGANAAKLAARLNYPVDVPILVAVDTDSHALNIGAHEGYVRAFAAACKPFPIGVYGDADILLRVRELSQIGWLPNASAWSSANRQRAIDAGLVHVLQRKGFGLEGVAVDPNDVIRAIRVWSKPAPVQPPEIDKPPVVVLPPTPISEGEDVQYRVNEHWFGGVGGDPGKVHFELVRDHTGRLRYLVLTDAEWAALNEPAATKIANQTLVDLGPWEAAPMPEFTLGQVPEVVVPRMRATIGAHTVDLIPVED